MSDENFYIYPPHYNTQGYKYVGRGSCDESWSQEAPNGNRTSSNAPIWNLNIGANKIVPKAHYKEERDWEKWENDCVVTIGR